MKHTIRSLYQEDRPGFEYKKGSEFFRSVMDGIMKETYEAPVVVRFPHGLGKIGIKRADRKKFVDWKESKQRHKLTYKYNLHTDGKAFRFHWVLGRYGGNEYSRRFSFRAARYHKRNLGSYIMELCNDPERYDYDAPLWV